MTRRSPRIHKSLINRFDEEFYSWPGRTWDPGARRAGPDREEIPMKKGLGQIFSLQGATFDWVVHLT